MRFRLVGSGLMVALIMATSTGAIAQESTAPPTDGSSVVWDSGAARFEADGFRIHAGDAVFTGSGPADVSSEPGDPTYRTLEVIWQCRTCGALFAARPERSCPAPRRGRTPVATR